MMQASAVISLSTPSFTRYSNTEVAEIAARVVEEFGSEEYYEEFYFERGEDSGDEAPAEEEVGKARERDDEVNKKKDVDDGGGGEEEQEQEEEFEFAFMTRDSQLSSPISADEIFYNGQIRPVYPVFNRDLFLERDEFRKDSGVRNSDSEKAPVIRLPLRKLFIEERETTMTRTSSSSSSEASELDGIPADTYCVWRPPAEGRCKKSNSSGGSNSKRWKLKNLLHRSHSDGGKGSFVILSPNNSGRKKTQNEEKVKVKEKPPAPVAGKAAAQPPPYNGGEKRRSYLPYRQELVGFSLM